MTNNITITLIHYNSDLTKGEQPPLGLLYLAGYLRGNGFSDINIVDLMLEKDQEQGLYKCLEAIDPNRKNLIGYYMNTHNRFAVRDAAEYTRKKFPDSIICAGGPHPTLDRESTMSHCSGLDFIVIGEGEVSFFEAVQRLSNDFSPESLCDLEGLSVRTEDKVKHNMPRARMKNLDDIPMPARDMVNIRDYRFTIQVKDKELQRRLIPATILTSRGCPFDCVFCSVADQWGRRNTYNSPDRAIAEMKELRDRYGFNALYFFDDTFTIHRKRVTEICNKMIEEKIDMPWFCEIRADTVNRELLELMYAAGCRSVAMGIESASPSILESVVGKGITLEQAEEATRLCHELGIFIKTFFSFSYPKETYEDVKMTLDFKRKLKPDRAVMSRLRVYPGTPLFNYAIDHHLLPEDFEWFREYPSYYSLSNDACQPWFRDVLSDKDIRRIEQDIRKSDGAVSYSYLWSNLIAQLGKVKSAKDLRLLAGKIAGRLRLMISH